MRRKGKAYREDGDRGCLAYQEEWEQELSPEIERNGGFPQKQRESTIQGKIS